MGTKVCVFSAQHRVLGSNLSRVCSLRMDNMAWTEPLIQVSAEIQNRQYHPAVKALINAVKVNGQNGRITC